MLRSEKGLAEKRLMMCLACYLGWTAAGTLAIA